MLRMKIQQTIALKEEDQLKYAKKTQELKKKIKSGKITISENRKKKKEAISKTRGLVYVAHLPHGFYEAEMKTYFKQFGLVTNVKVCRSRKTGRSKGFGYVEFAHEDVAKIAAETMNNYLMFKRKLVAEYVPFEKRPELIFCGVQSTLEHTSTQRKRSRQIASKNEEIDEEEHLKQSRDRLTRLQKKMQKLQELGVKCNLKPIDVPKSLVK